MAVVGIQVGGYYKIKSTNIVYKAVEIKESWDKYGLWVDTIVFDKNGFLLNRMIIPLIEFIKLADYRVKPR